MLGDLAWRVERLVGDSIRHNIDGTPAIRVVGEVLSGSAVFAVRQGVFTLEDGFRYGPAKLTSLGLCQCAADAVGPILLCA